MAEAPTMEVRARLSAETAQFTRGMEQARRSTEQLTQASNKLRGAMIAVGAGVGAAGYALISFGRKAFDAASRVDELDIALQAVGASTGIGYEALNESALAIRANGIEMDIAQKTALKFAQNNLNLADAAGVARVAQDLAVIGAMNSTDAFDRLTHAIITGRSEVLKSVGIQTSAGRAYATYAATLGKSAKDLSALERQQAVLNLVMKEGTRVAGTYEAAMTTPGKVLRSFARMHNELQIAVGGVLLKGFGPLIFETYETYKAFIKALNAGGRFKDTLEALGKVIVKLTTPFTNFAKSLREKIEVMNRAEVSIDSLAARFEHILPAVAGAGAGIAAFAGKSILGGLPLIGKFFSALKPFPIAFVAIALTSSQVRTALGNLFSALKPLIPPLIQLSKIMATIGAYAVSVLAKGIEMVAKVVNGLISFIQNNIKVFKILGYVIGALVIGLAAYRTALILAAAATALYTYYTAAMTFVHLQATPAVLGLNAALLANPIPLVIGALVALVVAFAAAWKNSETFRTVMENVFNFIAKIVGQVLGGVLRLFGHLLVAYGNLMDTNNIFGEVVAKVYSFVLSTIVKAYLAIVNANKFVIDSFISLMNNQKTFGQVVETVINFVIKAYLTYAKFVITVVKTALSAFVNLMESHATLRNVVEVIFNSIVRIIAFFVTQTIVSFANVIKGIATLIYNIRKIFDVVKVVVGMVAGAFFVMGNAIVNLFGGVAKKIAEFLKGAFNTVKGWVTSFLGLLMNIPGVSTLVEKAFSGMASASEGVSSTLKSLGESFQGVFGNDKATDKSLDAISKMSNSLIDSAKSWGNYETGVEGSLSKIANSMLNFTQKIVQFGGKDSGASIVENLVKGAKNAIPKLDSLLNTIDEKMQTNFGKSIVDTLVSGAKLASDGLGKMISQMEKLKDGSAAEFIVQKVSENAIKAGEFLIGLATGIESFTGSDFMSKVGDAFDGLLDKLKEGLGFADILEAEKKKFEGAAGGTDPFQEELEDMKGQADSMKKIREAMKRGIESIHDVIQDLKDAAKAFADSLKDVIVNFAGLKGVELPDGFVPQAKSLIENMKMRLDKSQQFATQIGQLQALGLDAGALRAIIEEGPIKGAQLAASILGGGLEAVQEISRLQRAIEFTGAAVGQYGADVGFSDLISTAEARLGRIEGRDFKMSGGAGGQVFIQQGAVRITIDATGAKDAEEMASLVVDQIERVFGTLAKELSAK
jgi:phage-related protein